MKEHDTAVEFCIILIVAIVGIIVGISIGFKVKQDRAIEAGVAYYNPTNAVFTWKTNLVEKGE